MKRIVQENYLRVVPLEFLQASGVYNIGIVGKTGIRMYLFYRAVGGRNQYYLKSARTFNNTSDTDVAASKTWEEVLSVLRTHECHIFDTPQELMRWVVLETVLPS